MTTPEAPLADTGSAGPGCACSGDTSCGGTGTANIGADSAAAAGAGGSAGSVAEWTRGRLAALSDPVRSPAELSGSLCLVDDLGVDSLGFIETLVAYEEEFGVRLDEERLLLSAYGTVADLTEHLAAVADSARAAR
ncbi:acyl carrier protein [Saccharopolyspora sp. 5N708]|uniref:acyl carrier protein n=1 Tax=Saccharopolyspora sp. 5N708 TaxID=3457424 RepID=UPI003FCF222B